MRSVSRFAPPLLLMGVIFFLSAQPDLNSGLGTWDTILRKLAHMAEFGLLWLLWWRALGYGGHVVPALIAIAYAVPAALALGGRLAVALPLLSGPIAAVRIRDLIAAGDGPTFNRCLAATAQLLLLFGGLFAAGLAAS